MGCGRVRLSTVLVVIYFVFSTIALVWAVLEISFLGADSDRLAFMSGLVMFVLGTWKGMLVSSLNRKFLGGCGSSARKGGGGSNPGTPRLVRPCIIRSAPPALGESGNGDSFC